MGKWLKGLRVCVSHFTKECDSLVGATFVSIMYGLCVCVLCVLCVCACFDKLALCVKEDYTTNL